jgi:hypothetical protein
MIERFLSRRRLSASATKSITPTSLVQAEGSGASGSYGDSLSYGRGNRALNWQKLLTLAGAATLTFVLGACTRTPEPPAAAEADHPSPKRSSNARVTAHAPDEAISEVDYLMEFPVCDGSPHPESCERGSRSFTDRCRLCHGRTGASGRAAPTLIGLVGRKRTFLDGRSLIADRAYVRRSIIDHKSDSEYIPGYKGTLDKVQKLRHPDAHLRAARRREESFAWEAVGGKSGFAKGEVGDLIAFIEWLSLEPLPNGSVRVSRLVPGEGPFDEEGVREELQIRLESIRQCYEFELEKQPSLRGQITVRFVGLPGGHLTDGKVIRDTLSKPLLSRCVADAVGYATAACSKPPRDGTVTLTFAPE